MAREAVHSRSFFSNAVSGIVRNVGIVGLEGAAHSVEDDAGSDRALVRRVGEDQTRWAARVGTKGDGVENGENGFMKTNHVVVRGRANNGEVALPHCLEEGDYV